MCGIVGVIGVANSANRRDVVNFLGQACTVGTLRGDDSTGIFQVDKRGVIYISKVPISGRLASETRGIALTIQDTDVSQATIMHHRAATKGAITYDNCHPFEHVDEDKYVCGVHNGTMRKWNNREDGNNFDVDSDWLYYSIMKNGAAKALSECDGSYALVWTERDDHIYIAANAERSLHWAKVRGDNVILVASEAAMLYWLASRNNLDIEDIQKPAINTIYKISTKDVSNITTIPIPVVSKAWGFGNETYKDYYKSTKGKDWSLGSRKYGPQSISDSGLSYRQEVDFYPSVEDQDSMREGIFGYLSADVKGKEEIFEAFISYPGTVATESIKNSIRCYCRVTGTGTLKTPSGDKEVILLEPPHRICMGQPEETEVAEERMEGPHGKKLTKKEWDERVKNGCVGCSSTIVPGELMWVNDGKDPLCHNCAEDMKEAFK
jgi:hypothetical protein